MRDASGLLQESRDGGRQFVQWQRFSRWRRGLVRSGLILGVLAVAAGCGSAPTAASPPKAPSLRAVKALIPKSSHVVKTEIFTFKQHAPEALVVSVAEPSSKNSVLGTLLVSAVTFNLRTKHWQISWRSPAFPIQRGYEPGHPVIPAIAAWKVQQNTHGALVGLLAPASMGADTLWNDGLVLWASPAKRPEILWMAKGGRDTLPDGSLSLTARGIMVNQEGCSAVEAMPVKAHARVLSLSCTDLMTRTAGQRLGFTARGAHIRPVRSTVTVKKGTTIIFWPNNAETARMVNHGVLNLYGGNFGNSIPADQVPLASADSISHFVFQFTELGTYHFAIVNSTTPDPMAPSAITVHVVS